MSPKTLVWWSLCIDSEVWWDLVVPWCKSLSKQWHRARWAHVGSSKARTEKHPASQPSTWKSSTLPHGNHPLLQHGVTTGQNTYTQPLKHKCMHTFPCKFSMSRAAFSERAQVNCLLFMSQLNNQIKLVQCDKEQTVWSCCVGRVCFNMSSVGVIAPSAWTQVTITKP